MVDRLKTQFVPVQQQVGQQLSITARSWKGTCAYCRVQFWYWISVQLCVAIVALAAGRSLKSAAARLGSARLAGAPKRQAAAGLQLSQQGAWNDTLSAQRTCAVVLQVVNAGHIDMCIRGKH